MKINHRWKIIIPFALIGGCVALLVYLITWQPTSSNQTYTTYTVAKKDVQHTIQTTGLVLTKIIDKEEIKLVQWYVAEDQVNDLAIDQEVSLEITALATTNTGKIYSIATEPRITGDNTEYEVLVKFNEVPEKILNGMHADVIVVLETKNDVLAVPNDSLTETDSGYSVDRVTEQRRIYLQRLNIDKTTQTLEPTDVNIGLQGDDYTEITSGLSDNDVIVAD